ARDSSLEEVQLTAARDRFAAARCAELAVDRAGVRLDRVQREVERSGDLAQRRVARQQPQHGELAVAEVARDFAAGTALTAAQGGRADEVLRRGWRCCKRACLVGCRPRRSLVAELELRERGVAESVNVRERVAVRRRESAGALDGRGGFLELPAEVEGDAEDA